MNSNVMIGANTEILIEILRAVSEIHDSITELKVNMKRMESDIQEIKSKLSDNSNKANEEIEGGITAYDYW